MKSPFTGRETDPNIIQIETLYSRDKQKSFVGISWGDQAAQFTPKEAREHAFRILEFAAGADQDEVLMRFLRERVGLTDDVDGAKILIDFRKMRENEE